MDRLTQEAKMKQVIDVNTGEVKVTRRKIILRSLAIGSCIVIATYDVDKKIAGLAHIMLPGSAPKKTAEKTKYAADAINLMISKMTYTGSKTSNIEACLVGGGNVLKKKDDTICKDNIASVTQILEAKKVPVKAAVLGGTKRKGLSLDVEAGTILYTEGDGKEKLLWKTVKKMT